MTSQHSETETRRTMSDLDAFLQERNALLCNPTAEGARKMLAKSGLVPSDDRVALAAIHKARLAWTGATKDQVTESEQWLVEHWFKPSLFGVPAEPRP